MVSKKYKGSNGCFDMSNKEKTTSEKVKKQVPLAGSAKDRKQEIKDILKKHKTTLDELAKR